VWKGETQRLSMMPDVFFGQIHRDIVKRFQNKCFRDAARERRFRAIQFLILKMTFEDSPPVIPSASDNAAQSNENTGNAKRAERADCDNTAPQ